MIPGQSVCYDGARSGIGITLAIDRVLDVTAALDIPVQRLGGPVAGRGNRSAAPCREGIHLKPGFDCAVLKGSDDRHIDKSTRQIGSGPKIGVGAHGAESDRSGVGAVEWAGRVGSRVGRNGPGALIELIVSHWIVGENLAGVDGIACDQGRGGAEGGEEGGREDGATRAFAEDGCVHR